MQFPNLEIIGTEIFSKGLSIEFSMSSPKTIWPSYTITVSFLLMETPIDEVGLN
jgi:hypothetical protein